MAVCSPQPLTLKIMENNWSCLISWRIEQATFQCDLLDIWPSETPTSASIKKEDRNAPLLLPSNDGAQWTAVNEESLVQDTLYNITVQSLAQGAWAPSYYARTTSALSHGSLLTLVDIQDIAKTLLLNVFLHFLYVICWIYNISVHILSLRRHYLHIYYNQ